MHEDHCDGCWQRRQCMRAADSGRPAPCDEPEPDQADDEDTREDDR